MFYLFNDEQLLEVTAKAVQLVIHWGETGLAVADGLANLLKVAASDSARLYRNKQNNSNSMAALQVTSNNICSAVYHQRSVAFLIQVHMFVLSAHQFFGTYCTAAQQPYPAVV